MFVYLIVYVRWDSGGFSDKIAGYGQKGRIEGRAKRGPEILVYIYIYNIMYRERER